MEYQEIANLLKETFRNYLRNISFADATSKQGAVFKYYFFTGVI